MKKEENGPKFSFIEIFAAVFFLNLFKRGKSEFYTIGERNKDLKIDLENVILTIEYQFQVCSNFMERSEVWTFFLWDSMENETFSTYPIDFNIISKPIGNHTNYCQNTFSFYYKKYTIKKTPFS